MNINYSIIIPHKDIPQLLQRCLDSIPQREDIQVIIVDDNSDPRKVDFSHFPGLDRPDTVCCFTKENKGAGYARNVGLEQARGKWLLFADADDFFRVEMLQRLDKWVDSDNDMVFFKIDTVRSETLEKANNRMSYVDYEDEKSLRYNYHAPWGRMIKATFVAVNNLRFDETEVSNDVMFSLNCGLRAQRIAVDEQILYTSTLRRESLVENRALSALILRLKVGIRHNRRLARIGVYDYTIATYYYLQLIRSYGRKVLWKYRLYYLFNESPVLVFREMRNLLALKLHKR